MRIPNYGAVPNYDARGGGGPAEKISPYVTLTRHLNDNCHARGFEVLLNTIGKN
jgi:hypothetical protein